MKQLEHDAPPMPQAFLSVPLWHRLFESQQPLGHVPKPQVPLVPPPPPPVPEVLHMPELQVEPPAHATQVTPLLPQAALVAGETQTVP